MKHGFNVADKSSKSNSYNYQKICWTGNFWLGKSYKVICHFQWENTETREEVVEFHCCQAQQLMEASGKASCWDTGSGKEEAPGEKAAFLFLVALVSQAPAFFISSFSVRTSISGTDTYAVITGYL